jgi:rod shape-determining protein MreD
VSNETSSLNLILTLSVAMLAALLLSIYPLPMEWRWWRPEFVLLVAIYWVFLTPLNVSFLALCCVGLFQDLLEGVAFGQHGLGLVIVAYISMLSYQRVRNFSLPKQTGWVFVLVGIAQLTDNWVQGMAGRPLAGLEFLYPALTSAILWPLLQGVLNTRLESYRQ